MSPKREPRFWNREHAPLIMLGVGLVLVMIAAGIVLWLSQWCPGHLSPHGILGERGQPGLADPFWQKDPLAGHTGFRLQWFLPKRHSTPSDSMTNCGQRHGPGGSAAR